MASGSAPMICRGMSAFKWLNDRLTSVGMRSASCRSGGRYKERQHSLSTNREAASDMYSSGLQTQEKMTRLRRQTSISDKTARSCCRRS